MTAQPQQTATPPQTQSAQSDHERGDRPKDRDGQQRTQTLHAMTVDVEDYFHVAALAKAISPEDWEKWPSRVEANTDRLLELFDEKNIKASFFVLGWVADRHPGIVPKIAAAGHEIASHGYTHQLVYKQSPEVFRQESERSKKLLEDQCGQAVEGYRAASYSITRKSLWALDILAELGFTWDSSIFPVHHDNYGIPGSPKGPYQIVTEHGTLNELPLTTAQVAGLTLPAAGGGYFRQYPYRLSRYLFARAAKQAFSSRKSKAEVLRDGTAESSQIFYLHPWEVDPEQPRVEGISAFSKFRHYTNLSRCYDRLSKLIDDFSFGRVSDCFAAKSDLPQVRPADLAG